MYVLSKQTVLYYQQPVFEPMFRSNREPHVSDRFGLFVRKRFPGWIQVRRRCRDDLLRSLSWLDFFIFRKHREASLAEDERQGQQEGQNSSDEELLIFH